MTKSKTWCERARAATDRATKRQYAFDLTLNDALLHIMAVARSGDTSTTMGATGHDRERYERICKQLEARGFKATHLMNCILVSWNTKEQV